MSSANSGPELFIEVGFRVLAWLNAENIFGWGAWAEPGERLPA